jgi:PX domain
LLAALVMKKILTGHDFVLDQYNINAQPSTESTESFETFVNIDKPDSVTVQIAPEKEGYIFKHVKYIVQNNDIKSRVLRRYNDFSWLVDTITRRYPSRMIPNLPPKNLGGSKSSKPVCYYEVAFPDHFPRNRCIFGKEKKSAFPLFERSTTTSCVEERRNCACLFHGTIGNMNEIIVLLR